MHVMTDTEIKDVHESVKQVRKCFKKADKAIISALVEVENATNFIEQANSYNTPEAFKEDPSYNYKDSEETRMLKVIENQLMVLARSCKMLSVV